MRMERMLADLEAAHRAESAAQERIERVDEVRVEHASVPLEDRLRAALGRSVHVETGALTVSGRVRDVGVGWCAIDRAGRATVARGLDELVRPGMSFVDLSRIESVVGLGPRHVADDAPAVGRSWNSVLRAVARTRTHITWHTAGGSAHTGLIDAVSLDHVLLRERGAGHRALSSSALVVLDCPITPAGA